MSMTFIWNLTLLYSIVDGIMAFRKREKEIFVYKNNETKREFILKNKHSMVLDLIIFLGSLYLIIVNLR